MDKKLYIIIIIVVVALAGFWWWQSRQTKIEGPEGPAMEDVSDINKELEGLSPDELENEFEQIDQDLNNL